MTTHTAQLAIVLYHEQLLEDLKDGEFEGVSQLEYEFKEHDHETQGSVCRVYLYEENQFVTSYLYGDADDARDDFAQVHNIYGITFKPMCSRIVSRLSKSFFK